MIQRFKVRVSFHRCKQNVVNNSRSFAGFHLVVTSIWFIVVASRLVLSSVCALAISKILLYLMRCRQTEKLIGELNQSVGDPTKRKVGDCMEFHDKILAGTKAKLTASQ